MRLLLLFVCFVASFDCFAQNNQKITTGMWVGELQLTPSDVLPFLFKVYKKNSSIHFNIHNGEEKIELEPPKIVDDSIHLSFPYFNSKLVCVFNKTNCISGYWHNLDKGENYKIPFSAHPSIKRRFSHINKQTSVLNVNGKWEVEFGFNSNNPYPAIGVFSQKKKSNHVTGTFLTETGDYRFLEGKTTKDSLFLSCFDGAHAFLFKAVITKNNTLVGRFFSGTHWQNEWKGGKNNEFKLTSPDELTYLIDGGDLSFNLKLLDGTLYSYPKNIAKNKVIIIQIMGTWCPNCLDETLFYKTLYDKYHDRGLEIISVAYEVGKNHDEYVKRVNKLKNKLDLNFTFLIGGQAKKELASTHFQALNQIISFPTSIFIDQKGDIVQIHTGFNGPGTGTYYSDYKRKTIMMLEYLLAQ